jgi:hypothetical protein
VPRTVADFDGDDNRARSLGTGQILFWEADDIDDRPDAAALGGAMRRRSLEIGAPRSR